MTESVADMTMSYEGLVEAGREARKQADSMQWTEGDLALQVEALPANERPRDSGTGEFVADEAKALKRYAEDVDLTYSTLQEYRRVAQLWPTPNRIGGVAWRTHQTLAAQADRFDLIQPNMTVSEATKIIRQRSSATTGKPGWHELLGMVGDTLTKAQKELAKVEEEIGDRQPNAKLREKAGGYANRALDLTDRLLAIEGGTK